HYQNLFHDPRASAESVAPSPLAQGAHDALVLGYFQLDAAGRASTPTINDELPELSEAEHLADNRRFRDEVSRSLPRELGPQRGALVASAAATLPQQGPPAQQSQVVTLDPSTYIQNSMPNTVYLAQRRARQLDAAHPRSTGAAPVAITVSPLEWQTLSF